MKPRQSIISPPSPASRIFSHLPIFYVLKVSLAKAGSYRRIVVVIWVSLCFVFLRTFQEWFLSPYLLTKALKCDSKRLRSWQLNKRRYRFTAPLFQSQCYLWWDRRGGGWHMVFACRGSNWGSASQPRAEAKHVLRSLPKASTRAWAPKAERSHSWAKHFQKKLLYFFLHVAFFSTINMSRSSVLCSEKQRFVPAVFTHWALKLTFTYSLPPHLTIM